MDRIPKVPDEILETFVPNGVYWLYSGFYSTLQCMDRFWLHSKKEEEAKNVVTKKTVIKGVRLQQAVQACVSIVLFAVDGSETENRESSCQHFRLVYTRQFLIAMLVMDTRQYFLHRYMHHNKFLYRQVHSQHHKLCSLRLRGTLLPPNRGASSRHCWWCHFLSPLWYDSEDSHVLLLLCYNQNRDNHCGLWLPGSLFHILLHNSKAYHDIHRHLYGTKYNFPNPSL